MSKWTARVTFHFNLHKLFPFLSSSSLSTSSLLSFFFPSSSSSVSSFDHLSSSSFSRMVQLNTVARVILLVFNTILMLLGLGLLGGGAYVYVNGALYGITVDVSIGQPGLFSFLQFMRLIAN